MIPSNNRFLMKTNPQITRALADSGSSLNHPEIQRLARQQVDLGIWSNLKLWVHRDLVKTRTSGSDLFVPKAYDMSGNNNDAAQATEANQPKLVSTGMEFDGSDDFIEYTNSDIVNSFSIMLWVNPSRSATSFPPESNSGVNINSLPNANIIIQERYAINSGVGVAVHTNGIAVIEHGLSYYVFTLVYEVEINNFVFIIVNYINKQPTLYINSSLVRTGLTSSVNSVVMGTRRIGYGRYPNYNYFDGIANDIRIFDKALSSTEISAIYNETKSYYGL